jgi:prepilin peptidase CpaA
MSASFPSAALASRGLLTALLLAACVTDVRARRIPNALVLAVVGAAFARAALVVWAGTPDAGLAAGLGDAALGAVAGLALWLPLYAVGAFGAGDVKLFAAAAAWLGPAGVPSAALYAALAGGVLGLAWLATTRVPALGGARPRVPYGVAIAAGVLGAVWVTP